MNEINLNSWQDFEDQLKILADKRRDRRTNKYVNVSPFLYRGHADREWPLSTTLERYLKKYLKKNISSFLTFKSYYKIINAAKTQIETFTNQNWPIPIPEEYNEWAGRSDLASLLKFPAYEYMIYLRHHGFPSPLLDWTHSPYIAAYFAFNNIPDHVKQVSIFTLLEYAGEGKSFGGDKPCIQSLGPYVKSHKRHFLQQSEYTICTIFGENGWEYSDHERVFSKDNQNQDVLLKFNIPSTERLKVLKFLDNYNLNSYSLFGTEESLMDTMALRSFFKSNF